MSLETIEGVNTGIGRINSDLVNNSKNYGYLGKPRNTKEQEYVDAVLSEEDKKMIPEDFQRVCAYARRVTTKIKKAVVREKYVLGRSYDCLGHYNASQCEWWLPNERRLAKKELGREISELEFAQYVLNNQRISESWRIVYFHAFPKNTLWKPYISKHKDLSTLSNEELDHLRLNKEIDVKKLIIKNPNGDYRTKQKELHDLREENYRRKRHLQTA